MLDPASQIFEHKDEVIDDDHVRPQLFSELAKVVEEGHDIWQADEPRELQALLSQQGARSADAVQVPEDGWPPLLEHELEELDSPVL